MEEPNIARVKLQVTELMSTASQAIHSLKSIKRPRKDLSEILQETEYLFSALQTLQNRIEAVPASQAYLGPPQSMRNRDIAFEQCKEALQTLSAEKLKPRYYGPNILRALRGPKLKVDNDNVMAIIVNFRVIEIPKLHTAR